MTTETHTEKPSNPTKSKDIRQMLTLLLKVCIAIGIIAWMVKRGTLDFSLFLRLAHPSYLLPCIIMLLINLYINNYRWVVLMRGQEFETGVKETLPLTFIGLFFNYAMPGGVGGDLVKAYYLVQDHPKRKAAAATSVLMDRIIGFVGMVVVSLLAIALNYDFISSKPELVSLSIGVVALFCAFILFFVISFSSSIYGHSFIEKFFKQIPAGDKIKKIYEAIHSYKHSPKYFTGACILTLLTQVATIVFFYLVGAALGIEQAPILTYMFVIPLGLIATTLPISPAGIGVGQAVFMVLFNWSVGHETQLGPSLITAHQLITFILGLAGAYFYFQKKKPVIEETSV